MHKRPVFFALTFVVTVVLGVPAVGAAQDAVDAHIAAVGGAERLAALQSMDRVGRATVVTAAGTFRGSYRETYDLVGDRGATTLRTDVFFTRTGWEGEAGWRDHSLQGFSEMDAPTLALAKMSSTPSVVASVIREYGRAALQPLEECSYEGQACDVFRFVGSPVEILVSREHHRVLSIVVPDVMAYHFADYEEVDGIWLPGQTTLQVPAQGLTVRYEYGKTTFDGKLKDRLFKRP